MKTNKRTLALVLAAMMVAGTVAGCSSQASSSSSSSAASSSAAPSSSEASSEASEDDGKYYRFGDGTVHIRFMKNDKGTAVKEGNILQEEINKITGLDIEMIQFLQDELVNKVSTMAASNDLPDIIHGVDFFTYAQQGVTLDIGDLVDQYGANLKTYLPEHLWEYTKYQGVQVAIPYMNDAGKYVLDIRQDWLDKLGLPVPTTLDDFYNVCVAFATQDPDGNGVADTYGFSSLTDLMPVYGAYGIPPHGHKSYYEDNGVLWPTLVSPNYKEVLAFANKLWEAGAIDPDIFIMDEDSKRMKMVQNKIGMHTDWWSITNLLYTQLGFQELNPDGSWTILGPIEGPGGPLGNKGMQSNGDYQGSTWLDYDTEHPVECMQLLDWMITDEGYYLCGDGIEGIHYTVLEDGSHERTEAGDAASDEMWLGVMAQVMGRRCDLANANLYKPSDNPDTQRSRTYTIAGLENYPLYANLNLGLPTTDAEFDYDVDVENFEIDSRIAFITGERSLDEYDAYVQEWLDRGGKAIYEDKLAQIKSLKGIEYASCFES